MLRAAAGASSFVRAPAVLPPAPGLGWQPGDAGYCCFVFIKKYLNSGSASQSPPSPGTSLPGIIGWSGVGAAQGR